MSAIEMRKLMEAIEDIDDHAEIKIDVELNDSPIGKYQKFYAIDTETYDPTPLDYDTPSNTAQVGYGRTKEEAVNDLLDQLLDDGIYPEEYLRSKMLEEATYPTDDEWEAHKKDDTYVGPEDPHDEQSFLDLAWTADLYKQPSGVLRYWKEWLYGEYADYIDSNDPKEVEYANNANVQANEIEAVLDGLQDYMASRNDPDPHGDRDPSPEEQAGWAMQDKIDRYRNEY